MNFYPHNIGDFANVAQYLDDASLGIFVRLLDKYMLDEKPIKTQWVSFAFQDERFEKANFVLENLFEKTEEGWIYAPMTGIIQSYRENAEKNRINGKKGGRPRKSETQPKPKETQSVSSGFYEETQINPTVTQTKPTGKATNNQEPITNNQEINNPLTPLQGELLSVEKPVEEKPKAKRQWQGLMTDRPEDITKDHWDQWIPIRKLKRLPVNDAVIEKMRREAEKAGLTLDQSVLKCIENGWAGFEARYLENQQQRKGGIERLGNSNPSDYLPNSKLKRQECRKYTPGI